MGTRNASNNMRTFVFSKSFTKRQRSIINFIGMLSKEKGYAIIPYLKDFSLCGIRQNKIKDELLQLEKDKVIFWDRGSNEFRINFDVEEWTIPNNKSWNKNRFEQLEQLNEQREE